MRIRFNKSYAYTADGFTIQNFVKDQEIDTEDERLTLAAVAEDDAAFVVPEFQEDEDEDMDEDEDEEELDSDGNPVIKPNDVVTVRLTRAQAKAKAKAEKKAK